MKIAVIFLAFFVCRIIQNIFLKKVSGKIEGKTQLLVYTAFQYLICGVLSLLLLSDIRNLTSVSPVGLGLSVLGGIAMFSSSMCSMTALKNGVLLILTTLFSSISIIVPTVASVFLFDEFMSIWQILGVAALLYASYLLLGISKENYRNCSPQGVVLLIGLFAAEGMTMLTQKCYPCFEVDGDTAVYTCLAFSTAFLLTGSMGVVDMCRNRIRLSQVLNREIYIGGCVLALMLCLIMYLGVLAVPLMPAVILYSVVAGSSLILAFAVGVIIFKEPATKKNVIGLLISIAALIVINAF